MNRIYPAFALILILTAFGTAKEASLVHIDLKNAQELEELQSRGIEIVYYNPVELYVEAILSGLERESLRSGGFEPVSIIQDIGAHVEQLRNQAYFKPFHTYEEMLADMEKLVNNYPEFVSLHDIGDSYNKVQGQGGYDIWAVKISDHVAVDDSTEEDVLIMANIHAREIITPEIVMYYMRYLLENYDRIPYVRHIVDEREIWLIPTANPDGHEYVFTGDIDAVDRGDTGDPVWWRKNMRDNNENGSFESGIDGVDLNRNFGFMWGFNNSGSSPNMGSPLYRGTGPFSEPETQAIKEFVEQHDFVTSLSFHSYGELLLYPWGYEALPLPEPQGSAFETIADSCVAYNNYLPGNYLSGAIYQVNGDSDDWLFGEHGIYAFTPEVGSPSSGRFWPDTSLIKPLILENLGPCLFISHVAGEEPVVEHKRIPDYDKPQQKYRLDVTIRQPIQLTEKVELDQESFKLFFRGEKDTAFTALPLNRIANLDRYTVDIPGDSSVNKFYYYVEAADVLGRRITSPRAAPTFVDSFKIAQDLIKPQAEHLAPGFLHPDEAGELLTVRATDNVGIGSVIIEYSINNRIDSLLLIPASDDIFAISLDSLHLEPGNKVNYRFIITDASANANQTILPESDWFTAGILKSVLLWDFEQEPVFSTNSNSDWEWGAPGSGPDSAFSGKKLWATGLGGDYSSSSDSRLESPDILLPKSLENPALYFRHWYKTEKSSGAIWDGGNVKISIDGGNYTIITPRGGYDGVIDPYNRINGGEPGYGGDSPTEPMWQLASIDLSPYSGHTVKVQFHFGSDDNTTFAGWFIDNVELLGFPQTETLIKSPEPVFARRFDLGQNYPNPFNSETIIEYWVPNSQRIKITIYNTLGQVVKTLLVAHHQPGRFQVKWDGYDDKGIQVPAGVYFYRMESSEFISTRKMLLLR